MERARFELAHRVMVSTQSPLRYYDGNLHTGTSYPKSKVIFQKKKTVMFCLLETARVELGH